MLDLDRIGPKAVFVWLNADEVLRRRYPGKVRPVERQFFRGSAKHTDSPSVVAGVGQKLADDSATDRISSAKVGEKRDADGELESTRNKRRKRKKRHEPSCGELAGRAFQVSVKKVVGEAHSHFKSFLEQRPCENLWDIPSHWGEAGLAAGTPCRLIFKTEENTVKRPGKSSIDVIGDRSKWVYLFALKSVVRPKFHILGCRQSAEIPNQSQETHAINGAHADVHGIQHAHAHAHAHADLMSGGQDPIENPESAKNLFGVLHRNHSNLEAICQAHDADIVMPGKSSFLMSEMASLGTQVGSLLKDGKGFDLIVMDPPWENKSVARKGPYQSVSNWSLLKLPMEVLMRKESCLVVVWMTNRMKHQKFVEQEFFPKWGLKIITTWFWLKVDSNGEMICSLEGNHHYPYEKLIIATNHPDPESFHLIPKSLTVVAMPGEHSRKPPLSEVLQSFLTASPSSKCLEMFARELTPGWSSWGNEVLHFQNIHRFICD